MNKTNHLSMNDVIGEHYTVVEVLAKDAFEILYLVRDNNRAGSLFILKELFFETFCSRENKIVIIQAEAQSVFFKQKQTIMSQVNKLKNNHIPNELKTFGYLEENNTIYTIMEYSTDAKMSDYLEFETELISTATTAKNASIKKILKYLLLIGLILLLTYLAFMAYTHFNESKKVEITNTIPDIELRDHQVKTKEESSMAKVPQSTVEKNTTLPSPLPLENPIKPKKIIIPEVNETLIDTNLSITQQEKNESIIESKLPKTEDNLSDTEETVSKLSEAEIKTFLDTYITASAQGSVDEIANFYDEKIEKYFKLNDITKQRIKKDKTTYNQKWIHREFSIVDFKILEKYKQKESEYVNIQTTTQWSIENKNGFKRKGKSKGFMKLKSTDNGLKIVSIYGLN